MPDDRPWYVTLFENDWYAYFAPGGAHSAIDVDAYARRTQDEAEFVARALGLPDGAAILDLCCGWGRHSIALARLGYRMTGLDLSHLHIEMARRTAGEAGVAAEWIEGDMREVPRPEASFDSVINMFSAFGYFGDEENQRVLEEVARVLRPGGRFLVDTVNRDNLMAVFRDRDWTPEPNGAVRLEERRWDARTGRVHAEWQYIAAAGERRAHRHDVRIYTLQELQLLMGLAGLRVDEVYGDLDGRAFDRLSRRLVVVAEKR